MRRAAVVLALLMLGGPMLGGCVSNQGPSVDTQPTSFADQARENNGDDPWKARSMCNDTSMGNEAKTVCY